MNANHVGALYPDGFGSFALASVSGANLATAGNAAAVLPAVGTSYIVRRITVANANATAATGNVSILTTNDGNTSNAIATATVLSNVSSTTTYQDLTLASGAATTVYSAPALFLKVNTGVAATADITVYGDIVTL